MAEKKYIVTITRQFGSLGRPIAREMSEILGIEYYDRDIVEATSKKMNLPVSKISEHEETYSTSLFPMLLPLGSDSIAKQDERCADYIFRDHRNVLNIYIYAKYAPGDPDSKQIMIDSSMLGVKGTAEVLAEIVQRRFGL